jgi:hypothetical protein
MGQHHAQLALYRICRADAPEGYYLLPHKAADALSLGQPVALTLSGLAKEE